MSKKRANGEGSIRKKPNGRWEGRYRETGKGYPGQPGHPGEPRRGLHRGGVVPAVV